jgi:ribonuclease Z
MPINPVEFSKHPAATNQEKVPEAVYKDENISVYAITVQTTEHSGTTGAKRKRPLSPDSPSKRSNVASETTLPSADNSFATGTVSDIQNTPENLDFSPESLEGEYAQRWRKAVVNFMFPGSKPSRDMRMEQKKRTQMSEKERSKFVGDPDLDMGTPTTSKKRIPPPIGLHKRLPEFKYPHAELSASVDPSSNPTLAYVIVGPQVRGKFDAQKAKELGIPNGRIRSKLTQGETIRFTVKDEKGELMEKVVRPEDCIGESESPGVRLNFNLDRSRSDCLQAILILDVPTVSHIPSLVSSFTESPFYAKFRSQEMEDRRQYAVRAVFHICGDGVLDDAGYRSFMRGFASDAHVSSMTHSKSTSNPVPLQIASCSFTKTQC